MNEWMEFTGKSVEETLTQALLELNTTTDHIEYEIIEKESKGFLGLISKPAKIRVREKLTAESSAKKFLTKVFKAMGIEATIEVVLVEEEETVYVNLIGDDMGVLIGKRGQTLDSLQYLTSLVINKYSDNYLKVKLDTENYRERRKETLENLAKNIASKVKRTHKPVTLEPMNPYERRIIHSALQNDKYVETHSEGEEPYRKVVITLKKGVREYNNNRGYKNGGYSNRYDNGGIKKYSKKEFHKKFGGNTNDYSTNYMKDYAAYKEQKEAEKAAQAAEKEAQAGNSAE